MKTFKTNEHSIFPRPFGVRGTMYLGVGVLVYYDLTDPENILTEQEMWSETPDQLGAKPVIDMGTPKARGEFLAAGSCFAPRGTTRPASKVRIRVGEADKTINVYGDRYWKNGVITEAEHFSEMPVVWENAFGGDGYAENPVGKGRAVVGLPDGSQATPLPNLELSDHQIGSPGDTPPPASFREIDVMCPRRSKKGGTYDKQWKEERWPYYPDDLDYEFFNAADADQFIPDFFQGGEPVTIENMHPDMARIESSLPRLRMRCFATLDPEFSLHTFPTGPLPSQQLREADEFREISMRLETVWLFPTILRGVCLYRGVTEIVDEEYMDVTRLLVRHESMDEEPKPIEHYRDLQVQLLNRGVDVDMAPFEGVAAKTKKIMVNAKNIKKTVADIRAKALGQRPKTPPSALDPEAALAKAQSQLAEHSARVDSLEAMAKSMQAEHGHLAEINLGIFDRMRANIADTESRAKAVVGKLSAVKKKLEAKQSQTVKQIQGKLKGIDPKVLEKSGVDIDGLMPADDFPFHKKINPWHDAGFPLVLAAREWVNDSSEARKALARLGLDHKLVRRHWLGWNPEAVTCDPAEWGLEAEESFVIPAGLVLPRFDGPVLNRILVLPDPLDFKTAFLVPGSDKTPLFLESATLIDLPTMPAAAAAPVVVAEDDLQALLLEQEAGDCVSVLTLASPDETPGEDAAKAVKAADPVLAVVPQGYAEEPDAKARWKGLSGAVEGVEPLELEHGATVFDDHDKGADLRDWIFAHLPSSYAAEHEVGIALPEAGQPPDKDFLKGFKPPIPDDIPGLVSGVMAEVKQAMQAKFAPLEAKRDALLKDMVKKAAALNEKGANLDLSSIALVPSGAPKPSVADVGKKVIDAMRAKQGRLAELGRLTPEMKATFEEKITEVEGLTSHMSGVESKLNAMKAEKQPELEAGLKQLADREPPEEAKAALARHGIDPDKITPLSREQVQRLHDQGQSLAGASLAGVDLSELDLSGANFSGCRLIKADFSKAILDEATFDQCMGQEAIFTGASLKGATMKMSMFQKAVFQEADLTGASCVQAAFKDADFTRATLAGADVRMASLERVTLVGADLTGAQLAMSIVGGDATDAIFRKAHCSKCLFSKATMDRADFGGATMPGTMFNSTTGHKVSFAGANLDAFRTGNNTALPEADFSGVSMAGGALRDSDLSGADFTGAVMNEALVENSMLVGATLNGVTAKRTRFTKSNLEGAVMRGANLFTGGLRKARLVDADLRGSNFYAADFYKAVLGNTRFDAANLKKSQLANRLELLDDE